MEEYSLDDFVKSKKCNYMESTHIKVSNNWNYIHFRIYGKDISKFHELYIEQYKKNKNYNFWQIRQKISSITFDIDLYQVNSTRQYTQSDVLNIIKIINEVIKREHSDKNFNLEAYVLEKNGPDICSLGGFKDGIHITYPYVIISKDEQKKIYHEVSIVITNCNIMNSYKNFPELFGIFPVNLPIYGSRTHTTNCGLYLLSYRVSEDMIVDNSMMEFGELLNILSI